MPHFYNDMRSSPGWDGNQLGEMWGGGPGYLLGGQTAVAGLGGCGGLLAALQLAGPAAAQPSVALLRFLPQSRCGGVTPADLRLQQPGSRPAEGEAGRQPGVGTPCHTRHQPPATNTHSAHWYLLPRQDGSEDRKI